MTAPARSGETLARTSPGEAWQKAPRTELLEAV
ncbi:hypothetical protein A2U01_0100161 [Trifolium medium]|uniref:Uncharacterized protein n=1 Tax=Trifolium medium TaxID=97028 RepID=A0A392UXL0_9FABA|nr:hypothetical protein [Trifolium medium]